MDKKRLVRSFEDALQVLRETKEYNTFLEDLDNFDQRMTPEGLYGFYPKLLPKDATGTEHPDWYTIAVSPDGVIEDWILNLH